MGKTILLRFVHLRVRLAIVFKDWVPAWKSQSPTHRSSQKHNAEITKISGTSSRHDFALMSHVSRVISHSELELHLP